MALVGAVYLPVNLWAEHRGVTVLDPARLLTLGGPSLDARIPFLPWTILPYASYLLVFAVPALVYPRGAAGARAVFRLCDGLVLTGLLACAVFLLAPAEMALRAGAEPPPAGTFLGAATRALRSIDPPYNTWPSLHVALPCLTVLAVRGWVGRPARAFLWTFWVVVSISTLTVKQHYLWDVLTGGLLGWAVWRLVVRRPDPDPEG